MDWTDSSSCTGIGIVTIFLKTKSINYTPGPCPPSGPHAYIMVTENALDLRHPTDIKVIRRPTGSRGWLMACMQLMAKQSEYMEYSISYGR